MNGRRNTQSRKPKVSLVILFALTLAAGCIYPHKVTLSGPILSADSTAFLNLKDATRAETISTLGQPVWESTRSRVLLYFSETTMFWSGAAVQSTTVEDPDHPINAKPFRVGEDDTARLRALFVAYDENGSVRSHSLESIRNRPGLDYEALCEQYAQREAKP